MHGETVERRTNLTSSLSESNSAQEVIAGEPVMVPYGELQTSLSKLLPCHVLKHKRMVPLWVAVAFHHHCLLLALAGFFWQQVAGMREHGHYSLVVSSFCFPCIHISSWLLLQIACEYLTTRTMSCGFKPFRIGLEAFLNS